MVWCDGRHLRAQISKHRKRIRARFGYLSPGYDNEACSGEREASVMNGTFRCSLRMPVRLQPSVKPSSTHSASWYRCWVCRHPSSSALNSTGQYVSTLVFALFCFLHSLAVFYTILHS